MCGLPLTVPCGRVVAVVRHQAKMGIRKDSKQNAESVCRSFSAFFFFLFFSLSFAVVPPVHPRHFETPSPPSGCLFTPHVHVMSHQ
jgi:hypothetical protein